MTEIKLKKGEPVDKALKKLKKRLEREGLVQELRKRRYYEKPSDIKYQKSKKAKFAARMQSKWDKENL